MRNLPASAGEIGDVGSIPGLRRSPGGGNGNPVQCSCLEKSHGQRSLVGYSPQGHRESAVTEHTHTKQNKFLWFILKRIHFSDFINTGKRHICDVVSQLKTCKSRLFCIPFFKWNENGLTFPLLD